MSNSPKAQGDQHVTLFFLLTQVFGLDAAEAKALITAKRALEGQGTFELPTRA
jgi:hypothetical protein